MSILAFLDPEHFVKGSYNVAFFFVVVVVFRVTLLLPMLLVVIYIVVYIHRYTPYKVLGAHKRRLEPPKAPLAPPGGHLEK